MPLMKIPPRQLSTASVQGMRGHIGGLILSNNVSDAVNDIDVTAGAATDSTQVDVLHLATGITKRLDAIWAVGTGQGGLDVGPISDGTYHVYVIKRSDTGIVDVLFSTNSTSPTMPAGYTLKRRIGSILRESGSIITFLQEGDFFYRSTISSYTNNPTPAIPTTLLTLVGMPTGKVYKPLLDISFQQSSSQGQCAMYMAPVASPTLFITVCQANNALDLNHSNLIGPPTSISAQVYWRILIFSGSLFFVNVSIYGWVDSRDKNE